MSHKFTDWIDVVLNSKQLPKYQPMTSKEIHYINFDTKNEILHHLIDLIKKTNEFIIETKCDYSYGYDKKYPALIQILFNYNMTFHIILIDTKFLTKFIDENEYHHEYDYMYLRTQIAEFFIIIFSTSNLIYSWANIKSDLNIFLESNLFNHQQIQNIVAVDLQELFQDWFMNYFVCKTNNSHTIEHWTLEMAVAFLIHKHLDTRISKSRLWGIGLFALHDKDRDEELLHQDLFSGNVMLANEHRFFLIEYAVKECMALYTILSFLRNDHMKRIAFEMVRLWYKKI